MIHHTTVTHSLVDRPPVPTDIHANITCTLAPTPMLQCCQHSRGLWPRGELLVLFYYYICLAKKPV